MSFINDRSGSVSTMMGLSLVLLVAAVGGAVDYSNATAQRAKIQRALDSATLSVGSSAELAADRISRGQKLFAESVSSGCNAEPNFEISGDTVNGTVSCNVSTFLLPVVGISSVEVSAESQVKSMIDPNAEPDVPAICVYVLDPSARGSFDGGGGGTLYAPDCGIQVNSTNDLAMRVGGGSVEAQSICVAGGVNSGCADWRCEATPVTSCEAQPDPMANFTAPSTGTCTEYDYFDSQAGNRTVSPGIYCGGLNFAAGDTTFLPGLYVVRDGLLQQGGGGEWRGEDVVFRFEGTGRISKGGSGNVSFSAPETGPYAGIVLYQAPESDVGLEHDFSGGGTKFLEGVVYLPGHDFDFGGGGGAEAVAPWTVWIVRKLIMGGGGDFHILSDFGGSSVPVPEDFELPPAARNVILTR